VISSATVPARPPTQSIALARLRPNGTLDPTFGTGGIVIVDIGGSFDRSLKLGKELLEKEMHGRQMSLARLSKTPEEMRKVIERFGVSNENELYISVGYGKVSDSASAEDIALGIVNLVFQSIGTNAVLAARMNGLHSIVFTGNLTLVDAGKRVLDGFSKLYQMDIFVPEHAEFATATGAALSSIDSCI